MESWVVYAVACGMATIAAYLWHVNRAMSRTPKAAEKLAGKPWTEDDVKRAYARVEKDGLGFEKFLPPKTGRRYIIVGGAGLCGKWGVRHLLQRGEAPSHIRILDVRHPATIGDAHGSLRGASKYNIYAPVQEAVEAVGFVKTDVTNYDSVLAGFQAPWPTEAEGKEVTVFHCAAVIRHWERSDCFYDRSRKVNVDGTENVVRAAQETGATVLVATSSGTILLRNVKQWLPPWKRSAVGYAQVISDVEKNPPMKKEDFFGNYPWSKHCAEKCVREADQPGGLRTGIIRPGMGIFGPGGDFTCGFYMQAGVTPSWIYHIVNSFIYVENVMLSHLLFEQRLLQLEKDNTSLPNIGGKAFLVTDPNPPIRFSDLYTLLSTCTISKTVFHRTPPIFPFLFSYLIEWYDLLQHRVGFLPPIEAPLVALQPALFGVSNVHIIVDDFEARKSPKEGGLGFKGGATTLDAMCFQVLEWNRNVEKDKGQLNGKIHVGSKEEGLGSMVEKAAAVAQERI